MTSESPSGGVDVGERAGAGATGLRVSVLGPVSVTRSGAFIDIGGPPQRAVLARLVAESGRVVSTDDLFSDLWEGEPPPKALARCRCRRRIYAGSRWSSRRRLTVVRGTSCRLVAAWCPRRSPTASGS